MRALRVVPHLRSSVVEEMPAEQSLLVTSRRGDADPALLADPRVEAFSWRRLVRALGNPDLEVLEVAEPLWYAEWVRAVRYVLLLKLLRRVLPGRRRVAVATYAIENLDARERLGFPSLASRPRVSAVATRCVVAGVGTSLRLLDLVAFGTSGASQSYRHVFGRPLRRVRHAVLSPRLDACTVCGPVPPGDRDPTVLFLGAPSERKGFPVLLAAWERLDAPRWRLLVLDPEGDHDPPLPPGASIRRSPPREVVHELLRSSAVVVLPSVRRPGWREQIGLPLVEGLAHGCRVVTTTETGLADDVRAHPLVTLTAPGDPDDLADGLRAAIADAPSPSPSPSAPAGWSKRDVVRWWLSAAGSGSPPGTPGTGPG